MPPGTHVDSAWAPVTPRDVTFIADITSAGAQRISVGGALTWVAAAGLISAAERIRDDGDFTALRTGVKIDEWL